MDTLLLILQIVVPLGIFNVWLVRSGRATAWRGGYAVNMKDEFKTYGLPVWFMKCIGFLKVSLAILILAGIWYPMVTQMAALALAVLMAGAVAMHIKIGDPLKKSLPAFIMLVLSAAIVLLIG